MKKYEPCLTATTVPLIDLAGSYSCELAERQEVGWKIHKACCDTGFFMVENHGVPATVLERHLGIARDFFALPTKEKEKVDARNSPCMRGYQKTGTQALDNGVTPDYKEGFVTGRELGTDHPLVMQGIPNAGPNQWPELPDGFRRTFETYVGWMTQLGRHLINCLALSLELPEDYFAPGLDDPMCFSQIYHYPPLANDSATSPLGAGAHTDWGLATMLLQDDVGGLEVQNGSGNWISVPCIPGTFVINLGDMMPILTNGLYRSNTHRVAPNRSGRSRYSAPTFFDPNYFYRVECVPTCLPDSGAAPGPSVSVGEHIAAMYARTYGTAVRPSTPSSITAV